MLDPKLVRESPDIIRKDLKKRQAAEKVQVLEKLINEDASYRAVLKELEELRHERNLKTYEMQSLVREKKDITTPRKKLKTLAQSIKEKEALVEEKKSLTKQLLYQLPNILHTTVPIGKDAAGNKQVRSWGTKTRFPFAAKGHEEIAIGLDILDLARAAKISGARFYFLKNEGVLLDMALQRFALEFLGKKGFSPVQPPFMMRREPYEGVVDLGDFEDVMYRVEGEDLTLIATSEHPLIAQFQNESLNVKDLPLKFAGVSSCFRKEAGSHGKDTKGIFRVHQFNKVEMIALTRPEDSWNMHEELLALAEQLYKKLELPYRIVNVCTGDIGSIAAKKYDLEVWMPVQKQYREAGSCSNATDYQARRLRIKFGEKDAPANGLVHTLNNTAVATTRTLAAILENFQRKDGSLLIPKVLRPYLGGQIKISPKT